MKLSKGWECPVCRTIQDGKQSVAVCLVCSQQPVRKCKLVARTLKGSEEFVDTNEDEEWSVELDAPRCTKTKKLTAMEG